MRASTARRVARVGVGDLRGGGDAGGDALGARAADLLSQAGGAAEGVGPGRRVPDGLRADGEGGADVGGHHALLDGEVADAPAGDGRGGLEARGHRGELPGRGDGRARDDPGGPGVGVGHAGLVVSVEPVPEALLQRLERRRIEAVAPEHRERADAGIGNGGGAHSAAGGSTAAGRRHRPRSSSVGKSQHRCWLKATLDAHRLSNGRRLYTTADSTAHWR
jgi:hypothetical protein